MSTHRTGTLRRKTWTTAAVTFSLFCSVMTAGLAGASGTPGWNLGIGVTLNLIAGVALIWRHERPWAVLGLALAGPLFFATDATAALIALFAVGAFARTRPLVMAAIGVYVACGVSLTYDAHRSRYYSVLTIGSAKPEDGSTPIEWDVPGWIPWVVAAVLVGLVVGGAILRRTRSDLTEAVVTRDKVTVESNALREQMLTAERARIARDMHDPLAASLSRISLFAGGLQVNSADGPEKVAQTASLIRQTAHDALDELKRIIGVLRGSAENSGGGRQSVEGISDLVHSARDAGLHTSLMLDVTPGEIGAASSHVAYRVVRESLTNAQKHAGGATVRVAVHGSDQAGVRVDVRNQLMGHPAFAHGSGTGLTGLAEQVRGVGGTFAAGP
ncbi:MAG: histidine kinase [Rhodococcus sp. (in: high G+C Gram-positive bacteria)]|uniref:sensor histidine kinase n=1 Tax=Rhodococcus sp. TaxID=1831 RepID=UPI002ADA3615|nr:histidine kinase [Rhodococcus sp. (in: high G+C Gram-positive bacteria)]